MSNVAKVIQALDIERAGDWDTAHRIVQRLDSEPACRVHAYLHRREGDLGNAGYWYARAGTQMLTTSLDVEWQELRDGLV